MKENSCPKCLGKWMAEIFWGYPGNFEEMEIHVERKEIVLGGCIITDNDPKWECNLCLHRWGESDNE